MKERIRVNVRCHTTLGGWVADYHQPQPSINFGDKVDSIMTILDEIEARLSILDER